MSEIKLKAMILDPLTSNRIRVFSSIKSTTIFSKDFSDTIACISKNGETDFFNRRTNGSQKRVADFLRCSRILMIKPKKKKGTFWLVKRLGEIDSEETDEVEREFKSED